MQICGGSLDGGLEVLGTVLYAGGLDVKGRRETEGGRAVRVVLGQRPDSPRWCHRKEDRKGNETEHGSGHLGGFFASLLSVSAM